MAGDDGELPVDPLGDSQVPMRPCEATSDSTDPVACTGFCFCSMLIIILPIGKIINTVRTS